MSIFFSLSNFISMIQIETKQKKIDILFAGIRRVFSDSVKQFRPEKVVLAFRRIPCKILYVCCMYAART